ncbi:serine/threonine-protein kinase [Streptomonospora wellingtoniae]|uniref:Serine/threonine-protein kinase n=1 Tax=Streptomonospora wellingtoniae TaxID=3075544 RepID=A0ABU2KSM3_9ACTN|nr:serine/threonine-protein kinase [Streptomonospora sp. DSM 45055]MDT0302284.1 serine/threonine-protein kinase [Streptomonospora sp. DSM 45055]
MPSDGLPKNLEPLAAGDPATIGPYVLAGRLGSGGMGTVYLGRTPEKGAQVAIKVIRPELAFDEATRARFRDEMENARRVASFCTAKVLDHGTFEGRPYMVTEYIAGTALAEHIAEHGALDSSTLHGFALGVAAALAAIHRTGLVHRDLKPANVLLSLSGPRVIDFGIARAMNTATNHTQTGIVMGSPGWMAPEQLLEEKVTTSADIFAWGCLVAFAGSGVHPFGNGDAMTLGKRVLFAEPQIGDLDSPLDRLVAQALAKEPERRPKAQDLLLELTGGEGESSSGGGDANEMVSHALHNSWRPNLPPMAPMPQPGPPPNPHHTATGMPHPPPAPHGPPPGAPPGQHYPGPPMPAQPAHHSQPMPRPAGMGPQGAQAQAAPGAPAPQAPPGPPQGPGGPQPPGQGGGPQGPGPQGPQGRQTGQFSAVSPNQTGPIPQVPPAPDPGQGSRPHAQPYVPPASLPPHRPMQPGSRKRWVAITAIAAAILVLLLFTTLTLLGMQNLIWPGSAEGSEEGNQSNSGGSDGEGDADAAPGGAEGQQSDETAAANTASDSRMVFEVREYECSPRIEGRSTVHRGTYCVFALNVQNTSSERITLEHDQQRLAVGEQEFQSASEPSISESQAPLWRSIPAGADAEGKLVFLVLEESEVDSGALHLSSGDGGSPAVVDVTAVTKAG